MKQDPRAQDKNRPCCRVAEALTFHEPRVGYSNPERRHELPVEYRDRDPEQEPDDSE